MASGFHESCKTTRCGNTVTQAMSTKGFLETESWLGDQPRYGHNDMAHGGNPQVSTYTPSYTLKGTVMLQRLHSSRGIATLKIQSSPIGNTGWSRMSGMGGLALIASAKKSCVIHKKSALASGFSTSCKTSRCGELVKRHCLPRDFWKQSPGSEKNRGMVTTTCTGRQSAGIDLLPTGMAMLQRLHRSRGSVPLRYSPAHCESSGILRQQLDVPLCLFFTGFYKVLQGFHVTSYFHAIRLSFENEGFVVFWRGESGRSA